MSQALGRTSASYNKTPFAALDAVEKAARRAWNGIPWERGLALSLRACFLALQERHPTHSFTIILIA